MMHGTTHIRLVPLFCVNYSKAYCISKGCNNDDCDWASLIELGCN